MPCVNQQSARVLLAVLAAVAVILLASAGSRHHEGGISGAVGFLALVVGLVVYVKSKPSGSSK